jgi:hypothetical protein
MAFQMLRVQALGAQGAAMADRHRLNELVDHRVRKNRERRGWGHAIVES